MILIIAVDQPDELIITYHWFSEEEIYTEMLRISEFKTREIFLHYHVEMAMGTGRIKRYPKDMDYNFEDSIQYYFTWIHEKIYKFVYVLKDGKWFQCTSRSPMFLTPFTTESLPPM